MVIIESRPLTLAEVADLAGDGEKADKVKDFIKKFTKIEIKKVEEMKEELRGLNLLKLKEQHIVKIIDFMPTDSVGLVKIIPDVSFDQDEVNKILEVVKKY